MTDDERPELPGFVVRDLLGRGGYASVWAAERDGAQLAIKVAHRGTDVARARAIHEATVLERMAGEHAPAFVERGIARERPYLVMTRVVDPILGAPADAAAARAVATAVAALHARGVAHGDLKPSNVALGEHGATLLDFGSAAIDGDAPPSASTPAYTAPERWRGEPASAASDVYALGALLYEIATGQPPFVGEPRALGHAHLFLRPQLAQLPPALGELLARCLAKDPAARPAAQDVVARLAAWSPSKPAQRAQVVRVGLTRTCAVVAADVRAEITAISRALAQHGGELLHVRGERIVAAWPGHEGQPVARAVAAARELHGVLGGSAIVGIERIPCDAETGELRPTVALAAFAPTRWRGAIATADVARALGLRATGLVDLEHLDPDAGELAPIVGRDAELARLIEYVRAGRTVAVIGEPGSGRTHIARHLAARLGPDVAIVDDADLRGDLTEAAREHAAEAADRARRATIWFGTPAIVPKLRAGVDELAVVELPALDERAAVAILEHALAIERIPDDLIARLVALGGGRPAQLVELAAHLERSGAIRTAAGTSRRYLAGDAVSWPEQSGEDWLAEAALGQLSAELRTLAAVCGVLEPGFALGELAAVVDHAPELEPAVADPEVALIELATRGIAAERGDGWMLATPALARAAERLVADPAALARVARAVSEERWGSELDARRRRALARYAAMAGDRARAAQLRLALADDARRAHQDSAAEADYTAALPDLADRDTARAHLGRGIVRYRIDRAADAVADLDRARELAERIGDPDCAIRARLEAATALDWLGRYTDSARVVDEIRTAPAELACALAMARGRSAFRTDRPRDAVRELTAAADAPSSIATDDDRVVALMMLGPALLRVGDLDAAEQRYDEAYALAERLGDTLARCATLGNRVSLWSARGDHARARADLALAQRLARRLGHAVPERNTTYNLAEYLYWSGELDEALRLARQSRELQHRLVGNAHEDDVLIARVAAAHGATDEARAALARADRAVLHPMLVWLADAVRAYLDQDAVMSATIIAQAEELVGEERAELLAWHAATAGDPRGELATAAAAHSTLQRWRFRSA